MQNSIELIGKLVQWNKGDFIIDVPRTSGIVDSILTYCPVTLLERCKENDIIHIQGKLGCRGNDLIVRIDDCHAVDLNTIDTVTNNAVKLEGTIKAITLRITENNNKVADLGLDIGLKDHHNSKLVWCVAFGQTALSAIDKVKFGSTVKIQGRLHKRTFFSKKDNQEKTVDEIAIFKLTVLDKKGKVNASKKTTKRATKA